jgi:hypothetical protein
LSAKNLVKFEMVNRFHMIPLVAIRPRSGIVILDENHNKNLG